MTIPAIFWPGSGSVPVGKTSLGLYDDDNTFVMDAPNVAKWVCSRLGYPTVDIELSDSMIYDCFEEAITEYSSQVNEFNMRENMLVLQGMSTGSTATQRLITGAPIRTVVTLAADYGTEAGSGGNTDWKMGYIDTVIGQQEYDLQSLWAAPSESSQRIEIRRVYHERFPAILDGGLGSNGFGIGSLEGTEYLLGEFGWAGWDGGLSAMGGASAAGGNGIYLMMPLFETLLRTQYIEINEQIRMSQYSFEIHNNKIRFMPMPSGERIFFQYTVENERLNSAVSTDGSIVSDFSNAPYSNMQYGTINDVGKRWVRKLTLILAKETLGRVLSKYENLPVPNGEVRLDGPTLRSEAKQEKDQWYDQLRESLDEMGRSKQMEKMAQNEDNSQDILKKAPLLIYIG